jgi:glycosyltransferase involved in cell wall biosynthesis
MPVFNAKAYLHEAVQSVLRQAYRDFEFIIIDDGSEDGSRDILQRYAADEIRIRLRSRPNRGLVQSLMEGLEMARGRYIARMDADDLSLPQRLEWQVAHLEAHQEVVALGCRAMLIDPEGAPIGPFALEQTHEQIDAAHLRGRGGAIVHPAAVFRREALNHVGGYRDEAFPAEDLDLFLRLAEVGRLANLPDVLYHYRQHPSSIGYSRSALQRQRVGEIVAEALRRRGLPDVPPQTHGEGTEELGEVGHRRKWAWWALKAGNIGTARKQARMVFRKDPFSAASWRLMLCALRGY